MNDNELRIKIYEFLGLEVGSLASESGNDWKRAEKEVMDEYRQKEIQILSDQKKMDYLKIDKNSSDFKIILESKSHSIQTIKAIIATRNDLDSEEINSLLFSGAKETIINLAKYQKLNENQIDLIIENGVYLAKKYVFECQVLSENNKNKLSSLALNKPVYYDFLNLKVIK